VLLKLVILPFCSYFLLVKIYLISFSNIFQIFKKFLNELFYMFFNPMYPKLDFCFEYRIFTCNFLTIVFYISVSLI